MGEQVREAARHHRLDEALSALHMESVDVRPELLSKALVTQLLDISLEAGAQLLTEVNASKDKVGWTLVQLERRAPVTFDEVRAELTHRINQESKRVDLLRVALKTRWSNLRVELSLARNDINCDAARSVGFTREVKVQDH